jgi:hypothetical protein
VGVALCRIFGMDKGFGDSTVEGIVAVLVLGDWLACGIVVGDIYQLIKQIEMIDYRLLCCSVLFGYEVASSIILVSVCSTL